MQPASLQLSPKLPPGDNSGQPPESSLFKSMHPAPQNPTLAPRWASYIHYGSPVFGYALSLALTALAGIVQITVLQASPEHAPFALFYPAIALAAFLAGAGPGLMTMVLAGAFGIRFFPHPPGVLSWLALALLGPVVATIFVRVRETRDLAVATARELARFKFIGDHASDWIFLLSGSGEIQYANRTACTNLGCQEAVLIGRRLETLVPEAERPALRGLLTAARSGPVPPLEITFRREDQSTVLIELICTGVHTEQDQVIHAAARDITERRQIEQKLRDMRHWESLGVMAGGMAHDFNNLLMSTIGNASLARDLLPPGHPSGEMIDGVISAGERAADLIRLMLDTSGHKNRDAELLDLSHVLNWILSSRTLPAKVRVEADVEPITFVADQRSMQTLLFSLISNAAEAYGDEPGQVMVRIRSGAAQEAMRMDFEDGQMPLGECVTITVEDKGCGMKPEVLERAFDPFFSTKFTGRGLGLPAVRGLVRAYSGKLRLTTTPGEGTRVEVLLPSKS